VILGIPSRPGLRVMVATKPIDFRKGIDGLVALVTEVLAADPFLCVGRDYVARQPNSAVMQIKDRNLRHIRPAGHRSRGAFVEVSLRYPSSNAPDDRAFPDRTK
jgi:transposase